jgi:hypothetical protein
MGLIGLTKSNPHFMMKGSIGIEVTHFTMLFYIKFLDAPPNSSKDSNMNLKMKTMKEKGIGVRSLIRNILGVRRPH